MCAEVSVCIPVYNGEKFIAAAIESVLGQTFEKLECVVADNCSTDQTVEIVKKYMETDSRVRLVQNDDNYGMVGNWNICVKVAKTSIIHMLCADDMLESECIIKKYDMLKENPNVSIVTAATSIVDENNKVQMVRHGFGRTGVLDGEKAFKQSFRRRNMFGEPSNVMFRKEIFQRVGGFSDKCKYSPDWQCWLKMSTYGDVGYIDEPLTRYRISRLNLTSSYLQDTDLMQKDEEEMIRSLSDFFYGRLSAYDKVCHRFNVKIRMCARRIFYIIKAKQ